MATVSEGFVSGGWVGPPNTVFSRRPAFRLQGTTVTLLGSVSGLASDADPVRALEAELRNRAAPEAGKPRR
jgi:hypothetical protein